MTHRIAFLISLVLLGCSKTNSDQKTSKIEFDGKNSQSFTELLSSFSSEVIILETTDESLLGDFRYVQYSSEDIFILSMNEQTIYRFGKNGSFKNQIGSAGNGPGQYTSLVSFHVVNDGVEILSNKGNDSRIYSYSLEGIFQGYRSIENRLFYDLTNFTGLNFFSNGSNSVDSKTHRVFIEVDFAKFEDVLPLGMNKTMALEEQNFSQSSANLFFKESLDPTIYKWSNGKFEEHLTFDFGKYNMEPEYFEEGDFYEKYSQMMANGIGVVRKYLESTNTQMANIILQTPTNPGHHLLFIDKNTNKRRLYEAMSGRILPFNFQGETLSLILHPADLQEQLISAESSRSIDQILEKISGLDSNDNPIILKIDLSALWADI